MSDIFSTFLSSESSLRRNIYKNKITKQSNKIFLDNGLRLSKQGNVLKLPKLRINSFSPSNKNKSFDDLNLNKGPEILLVNAPSEEENKIFENKYLNNIKGKKGINEIKYNKISDKKLNEITMNNKNKAYKYNNNNKYKDHYSLGKDNRNKNEKSKERQEYIEHYIESLIKKGKKKTDKFSEATKKVKENKFFLENSINPAKYIQKQILDDKFDLNDFRTAKIQKECFNWNQKFREANYKNIKINIMNNIFLNSMEAEPEATDTKFLIDQMLSDQKHLNKFNFSKNIYNRKKEETID